ncbi:MAG: F0F1 ATP synthase subunit epsilon [Lautropia sp.]
MVPTGELFDRPVVKLVARGADGSFCLLPRHADVVAALVPGIAVATDVDGVEHFIAADEGLLVKVGPDVLVSVAHAVLGHDVDDLREALDARLAALDDEARRARSALARLEASALRGFLDLEQVHDVR